jgi:serine/threonine protein kinase
MAPEVICRMNHSFEADFFALGVIVYEMMLGSVLLSLFSDPIWETLANKFVIRFSLIKLRSVRGSCLWAGVFNL